MVRIGSGGRLQRDVVGGDLGDGLPDGASDQPFDVEISGLAMDDHRDKGLRTLGAPGDFVLADAALSKWVLDIERVHALFFGLRL